ncbi:hypothetical protein [Rhizobium etli]|uniref:hypothetical protein n=1 Tax=Rhizobium etli TaxID=29449 RepID=UPI00093BCCE7|nr:hypothetical protein [Rhizobium etli]
MNKTVYRGKLDYIVNGKDVVTKEYEVGAHSLADAIAAVEEYLSATPPPSLWVRISMDGVEIDFRQLESSATLPPKMGPFH